MPEASYRTSFCRIYFGRSTGTAFLAELHPALMSNAVITAAATPFRAARLTSAVQAAKVGMTADLIDLVFTATVNCRQTAEVLKLTMDDNIPGFLVFEFVDAIRMLAIPADCTATPITNDEGGDVGYALAFTQNELGSPVFGPLVSSGSITLSTGQEGYVRTATGIQRVTATHTLAANTVGVGGDPLVAEGID